MRFVSRIKSSIFTRKRANYKAMKPRIRTNLSFTLNYKSSSVLMKNTNDQIYKQCSFVKISENYNICTMIIYNIYNNYNI